MTRTTERGVLPLHVTSQVVAVEMSVMWNVGDSDRWGVSSRWPWQKGNEGNLERERWWLERSLVSFPKGPWETHSWADLGFLSSRAQHAGASGTFAAIKEDSRQEGSSPLRAEIERLRPKERRFVKGHSVNWNTTQSRTGLSIPPISTNVSPERRNDRLWKVLEIQKEVKDSPCLQGPCNLMSGRDDTEKRWELEIRRHPLHTYKVGQAWTDYLPFTPQYVACPKDLCQMYWQWKGQSAGFPAPPCKQCLQPFQGHS
ncbi:uncharacterized protein [Notamacropus eugenii]|uniref:uncharacterized protein n=1 Tax=Notamacropus eugenii TaxID=9315 RepID=UPI003B672130